MKEIQMKNGYVALIDDEDYEASLAYSWYGSVYRGGAHVYATTNLRGGGRLYLHHLVMGKPEKGYVVDHINGDCLDNRRDNLRFATHSENAANRNNPVKNKTGFRCVYEAHGRYYARYVRNRVRVHLAGTYATPEEAATALDAHFRELAELEAQEAAA